MFKTLYNRLENRLAPFEFKKPSKTIQEPKEDCDINHIVEVYCGMGAANMLLQQPIFESVDVGDMPQDLLSAYEMTEELNERFNAIPSKIRQELGNSPQAMLQWIQNPNNVQRGVELGIFNQAPADSSPATGNSMANAERAPVMDGGTPTNA